MGTEAQKCRRRGAMPLACLLSLGVCLLVSACGDAAAPPQSQRSGHGEPGEPGEPTTDSQLFDEPGQTLRGGDEPGQTSSGVGESDQPESDQLEPDVIGSSDSTGNLDPALEPSLNAEQSLAYLRYLAPILVGRSLSVDEAAQVGETGMAAIRPVLQGWVLEPGFTEMALGMIETRLGTGGGEQNGIDYDLPGHIIRHVVQNEEPWAKVLTSETCYDADDNPMPCDTGAPYAAGVLTTRAFLVANDYRFNFFRAVTMMQTFACSSYPMAERLQPRIEAERLHFYFRAQTREEQAYAESLGGFGNGFACYTCHGQLAAHTQPYVKFDSRGFYRQEASGLQEPEKSVGVSFDGLRVSHLDDPAEAKSEATQMFAEPVENLRGTATRLANHDVFLQCAARNLIDYAAATDPLDKPQMDLLDEIVERARQLEAAPSLQLLAIETFSEPKVVTAIAAQLVP